MTKFVLSFVLLFFCLGIHAQLDRSIMPKGGPTPKIKLDKPKEFKLKNGIKVLFVENNKIPRDNYLVRFDRKTSNCYRCRTCWLRGSLADS